MIDFDFFVNVDAKKSITICSKKAYIKILSALEMLDCLKIAQSQCKIICKNNISTTLIYNAALILKFLYQGNAPLFNDVKQVLNCLTTEQISNLCKEYQKFEKESAKFSIYKDEKIKKIVENSSIEEMIECVFDTDDLIYIQSKLKDISAYQLMWLYADYIDKNSKYIFKEQ